MAEENVISNIANKISGMFTSKGEVPDQIEQLKSLADTPSESDPNQVDNIKNIAGGDLQVDRIKQKAKSNIYSDWIFGVNTSIASILDSPEELYNLITGTEPGPTGRTVRELFSELGFTPPVGSEPTSSAYSGGVMVGYSLPLFLVGPLGAGIKAAAPGLGPVATIGRAIVKDIGETIVKSPFISFGLEAVSATASGVGGHIARERFPDSPAAEGIGYVLGGLSPLALAKGVQLAAKGVQLTGKGVLGLGKALPLISGPLRAAEDTAISTIQRVRKSATASKAKRRAVARIGHAVKDSDAALRGITDTEVLPEAKLTPSQKTGEPLLMSLERSVIESSDTLQLEADQQISELNTLIHKSVREIGGDPKSASDSFESGQKYLTKLLDGRLRIAAKRADERISRLSAKSTAEEANLITNEELKSALTAARGQEEELYNVVPDDIATGLMATRTVLRNELIKRGRTADPADIPEYITKLLGNIDKKGQMTRGSLKGEGTIGELRTLRSRILRSVREEKANPAPNFNSARIMDDIQGSLLADMGAERNNIKGEAGKSLRMALDFSSDLHDRFSRGPVAKVLGRTKQGGAAVPPELTLESTLGIKGPKAALNAKSMINAVKDKPEELTGAIENFVKSKFNNHAVRDGRINQTKAEGFLRDNKAILGEFPAIENDIMKAIEAENASLLIGRHIKSVGARLGKPNMSKATMFIEKEPAKAFESLMVDKNVATETQNLINKTLKDTTGEALEGFQASFAQWVLKRSTISAADINGENFVSGTRMQHLLADPKVKVMAEKILTPKQMKRLELAQKTAMAIDHSLSAKPSKEGIMADGANELVTLFARIGGAQIGRQAAVMTGGGTVQTPGIFAEKAKQLVGRYLKDPAERLIIDAITSQDDDLMEALIRGLDSPENIKFVSKRLNAWAISTLHELGGTANDIEQEQQGR